MKFYYVILLLILCSVRCLGAERLHFRYINGVPCAEFTIRCGEISLRANLMIDLGQIDPVVLHSDFSQMLTSEKVEEIFLYHNSCSLEGLQYKTASIEGLDEFTRDNAEQLAEIPVWGILGCGAFNSDMIMLDLQNGFLDFGSTEIPSDALLLPIEQKSNRYISEIEPDVGYKVKALLTTADYESVFDSDCAAIAGSETADFENCNFASINLRKYTAIRVRDEYSCKIKIADCVIANSFWQNFHVYLDCGQSKIALVNHPNGIVSDLTEQIFYNSLAEGDMAAIVECLGKYLDSRLVNEANQFLLDRAIESGVHGDIETLMDRIVLGKEPKHSAETLFVYAQRCIENNNYNTAELFLSYAKKQVLKTNETPLLRGRIDSYRGWIALNQKKPIQARIYLLSALLINPNDSLVNYLMGNYHLEIGEMKRAWARYLNAALSDQQREEAIKALRQLDTNEIFRKKFTVDDACDFLEGHIFQEEGKLTDSAKMLKYRGGNLIRAAFDKLQEKRK